MKKIFPYLSESSIYNSFKLIIISEGYTALESALFISDCIEFSNKLLDTPPFNYTRVNPNWINIYALFAPSQNHGILIGNMPVANRTAFDAYYNPVEKKLFFNNSKITTFIDGNDFQTQNVDVPLKSFCLKEGPTYGKAGTLLAFLSPSLTGIAEGGELEYVPLNDTEYYYVATTKDGLWHQVIIRGLCRTLGLGDEFEVEGADFLEPPANQKVYIPFYNLEYFDTAVTSANASSKWYPLFSSTQRSLPILVHAKSGSLDTPDYSIDNVPLSHAKVEYWEGGGGFRTKIYRSAKDCLQRRQIGNALLPTRDNEVSFCPACEYFLKNIIF